MSILNFLNPLKTIHLDAAEPWQLGFQDSATPVMEGINSLHDSILFYLIVIVVGVLWALISIIYNFASTRTNFTLKYLRHGTLIEIVWTITPALILISSKNTGGIVNAILLPCLIIVRFILNFLSVVLLHF